MIPWRQQYVGEKIVCGVDCSADPEDFDRAVQSYHDECDINVMMERFGVTGHLPVPDVAPFYGDFSEVGDYRSALDAIRAADEAFESLPSAVRTRFANDPAGLIAFVQDDRNRLEAEALGLVPAPPAPVQGLPIPPAEGEHNIST